MNETSKARSSGLDEFLAWVPLHPRFWRRQKARVHVKRGFENYVAGKSHEAVVEYGRALDYEPTWTDVLLQRAMASFRREDFKAAEQDCTRALEIRPRDADALLHRASARIALGEHDSAIEDCEQVLEDESQAPGAFVSRAVARYSRGEVDAAIEDLDVALGQEPTLVAGINARGYAYATKGELDKAVEDFRRVLELQPRRRNVHLSLGCVACLRGETEEARACFEEAETREGPESPYGSLFLWYLDARRAGSEAAARLRDRSTGWEEQSWVRRLAGYILEGGSDVELLDAVAGAPFWRYDQESCEAWFYIAMRRLLAGERAGATEAFRSCLDFDRSVHYEHWLARGELRRLEVELE